MKLATMTWHPVPRERTLYLVTALVVVLVVTLLFFLDLSSEEIRTLGTLIVIGTTAALSLIRASIRWGWTRVGPIAVPVYMLLVTFAFAVLYRVLPSFWIFYFIPPLTTALSYGAGAAYACGILSVIGYNTVLVLYGTTFTNPPEQLLASGALIIFGLLTGNYATVERDNRHLYEEAKQQLAERQQAEAALKQSEERYRSVVNQSADSIFLVELQTGRMLDANPALQRLLGYSRDELAGLTLADFTDPNASASNSPLPVWSTQPPSSVREERYRRKDGTLVDVEVSANVISFNRSAVRCVVARDITERKLSEQLFVERTRAMEHARALERSNRELEEFAFVASHDLKEPLHKILAFGERLKMKYGQFLGEQGQDYLERMLNAARRMQTLIDDLLALSRVTTAHQTFVPVDLAQVTHEVLSDLEARIEQVDGQVQVGDLPTVEADPVQMRQLLQNLLSNALKFRRPAVTPLIQIASRRLLPGEHTSAIDTSIGEFYQITVEDNGIGFEEKYLDRIFGVFQRLHGRGEYDGTGIGLAICRKIVERHGGEITARSVPGQGATFLITLPARQLASLNISPSTQVADQVPV